MKKDVSAKLAPASWPYVSPSPGQFPIVVSTIFPEDYHKFPVRENYVEAIDAGVNTGITGVPTPYSGAGTLNPVLNTSYIEKILSTAAKTGINLYLSAGLLTAGDSLGPNNNLRTQFLTAALRYPETKGFTVRDEPYFEELATLGQKILTIQNLLNSITSKETMLYVNLAGTIANRVDATHLASDSEKSLQGNLSYPAYLKTVWDELHPQVWSFDFYPFNYKFDYNIQDGEGKTGWFSGTFNNLENKLANLYNVMYYHALQSFHPASGYLTRPFWAFCMTSGHILYDTKNDTINVMFPVPTIGQLRLEAFTALAFGAQGIRHWVYAKRSNQTHNTIFLTAPVNKQAKKTAIWYTLRQLNNEIQRYSSVFLNAQFVDFGMFPKQSDVISDESVFISNTCVSSITVTGGRGVLATHLKNSKIGYPASPAGESNFLVVVSRDPESTIKVNITFKSAYVIEEITPVNVTFGDPVGFLPQTGPNRTLQRTLSPGSYLIFRYYQR